MIYKIVTAFCLALMGLELMVVLAKCISLKNRSKRIAFLRGFKKGGCVLIYLTALPLYYIGHIYGGEDWIYAIFRAVKEIISLVVMGFDSESIRALMDADRLYKFTVYFCYILVTCNALLFSFSLVGQFVWSFSHRCYHWISGKPRLLVFGNNAHSIQIYQSARKRSCMLVDKLSDEEKAELYIAGISYENVTHCEEPIRRLLSSGKRRNQDNILIINTEDDQRNIAICHAIAQQVSELSEDEKKKLFGKLRVYVFGDSRYEAIYEDIVSDMVHSGAGCIHYVNRHRKIAVDFVDKYPFSRFMGEEQIDYRTSLVRDGVEINAILVGFGSSNQQIFLTSVANNQFVTGGEDGPKLKPVNYFIFDKAEAEQNMSLNHGYYRLQNECGLVDPAEYLPLPAKPAVDHHFRLDINHREFYETIRSIVSRDSRDVNFLIIAFGSDLENMDLAQKLLVKRQEWGLDNLVIFVKARGWHKDQTMLEQDGCYFIGNEEDVVYNLDKITYDQFTHMAQLRNEIYGLEYQLTHGDSPIIDDAYIRNNSEMSFHNWYAKLSPQERESNLYCCLSLRSKLNMMGLDYCDAQALAAGDGGKALTEEAYLRMYAGTDLPNTARGLIRVCGKPVVHYTLEFADSRRKTMAIQEHYRWNSFMISKGMIPATRTQILEEQIGGKFTNGKNYSMRRHGNLTSFDGLVEFRKMVAQRDHRSEAETDVIKYDYQLLDDAYWLLDQCGYAIIPKE